MAPSNLQVVKTSRLAGQGAMLEVARQSAGFWRRLFQSKLAMISVAILLATVVLAVFSPIIAPEDPNAPDFMAIRQPPSETHWLGTDTVGRDVLSRVIFGSRVSLAVAVVAVSISLTIGVVFGATSGFFGGWVDAALQRVTEVLMAFPALLLIITIATALGPSLRNSMLIIGLLGWVTVSRLMRAEVLSLKERDFVLAARTLGATNTRIITRHVLPNATGPLIVNTVFALRAAILTEAALSFIGVGVPQPTASWGNMINLATSITYLQSMPWAWIPPTIILITVVIAFSFFGDAVARTVRR